jgi:hypothetical protein
MSARRRKKRSDQEDSRESDRPPENRLEEEQPEPMLPPLNEQKPLTAPEQQKKKKRSCLSLKCLLFKVVLPIAVFLGLMRLCIPLFFDEYLIWTGYGRVKEFGLPKEQMHIFSVFDGDKNGVLDPEEFGFVVDIYSKHKNGINATRFVGTPEEPHYFLDQHRGAKEEYVEIKVDFEPLVLSSMRKFSSFTFSDGRVLVPGLAAWQTPNIPVAQYGARNFEQFAPPPGKGLGKPYHIIKKSLDDDFLTEMMVADTTPYKHAPPHPASNETLLHALMMQFHKYPFVHLRFGPRGTVGVVRAENDEYWDILIRAHVEFQLNDYPDLPFWFTPAQFAGRLIMSKDSSHIVLFEMEVPTNRTLNIDMEWISSPNGDRNEVDIGFVPLMKLSSMGPSRKEGTTTPLPPEAEPKWTKVIAMQSARNLLERFMYPFKAVKYHDFKEAFDLASEQQKPVHHILLWGALDDQSC